MLPLDELRGLVLALGIGLLVGVERERRKGEGDQRAAAGLRTFGLIALSGAIATLLGGVGLAVAGGFIALAALASYRHSRDHDPGLTTEVAMLVVFLLGALAMRQATLAAALGVAVALLLAGKSRLHRFVRQALDDREVHDGLLLAAAAAIVLPLLPDRTVDPWQVLNLRKLWLLALIVMAISAAGHIALRLFGARAGLLLAGLAGGFASSTATIASMGTRAKANPPLLASCAAAALLSNVSTVVQLAVVTGAMAPALLRALALPLLASGLAVVVVALIAGWRSRATPVPEADTLVGRAFEPGHALAFVAMVATAMLLSAAMLAWLGDAALEATLAVSGLADVHAAAASAAQLVSVGRIDATTAVPAVLLAFTANSLNKLAIAWLTGGRSFAWRLLPGIAAMLLAFVVVVGLR